MRARWRSVAWVLAVSYLVLLAGSAATSAGGGEVAPAVWIVAAAAWPLPVAAAVTARSGGTIGQFLRNLAGTVAASLLVFFPAVLIALGYWAIWRPDSEVPPVLIVGGLAWSLAGIIGMTAIADWKQGGGENWFD